MKPDNQSNIYYKIQLADKGLLQNTKINDKQNCET